MNHFNWTCPYCKAVTTIVTETNYSHNVHFYNSKSNDGYIGLATRIIVCPNLTCKEYTITASLHKAYYSTRDSRQYIDSDTLIAEWNLKPNSSSIPQPDYIPLPIRLDYQEACSILTLSPKASATLSRRCLQGMIRDFWGISKNRLIDEINDLKDKVDSATWEAIDAIRSIGNIGAHMEKDINLIIEIEPNEAQLLIKLIEDLFKDWYVNRFERQERLAALKSLREKQEMIKKNVE